MKYSLTAFVIITIILGSSCIPNKKMFEEKSQLQLPFQKESSLKLSNTNGYVDVSPWNKDSVMIEVRKIVRAKNEEMADKIMKRVVISYATRKSELSVETEIPNTGDVSVEYKIFVPTRTNLDLGIVNGAIRCYTDGGNVTARTANGEVSISIAKDLKPVVTAETINGRILSDLPLTPIADFNNKSGTKIFARTANGNIVIKYSEK